MKKKNFVCHHCGASGHIRPYCNKLKNLSVKGNNFPRGQSNAERPNPPNRMSPHKRNSNALENSKGQVSLLIEEVKKLSQFANHMHDMLMANQKWKPKSRAFGEGEYFASC